MLMILPLIQKRRSIRKYRSKAVEPDKISALVEAALRSPSSMGYNPWEFVVVDDPKLLDTLSNAKPQGSAFIKNAPLGIVVCADPEKSSVWIEDASIACIFIQLTAESLGLGSCWIQIRERMHDQTKSAEAYICEALNIPKKLKVEAMIAIGYPDEQKAPRPKEDLLYGKVHQNLYGKPHKG
jgi:nitroreductase